MTRTALPAKGRPADEILTELKDFSAGDPDYKHGRLWSLVYYLDEDYADFLGKAYQQFASANGLNPTAFKSLKRFENEIIAAVAELFHGTPEVCGVVTSGGTESCLLASCGLLMRTVVIMPTGNPGIVNFPCWLVWAFQPNAEAFIKKT